MPLKSRCSTCYLHLNFQMSFDIPFLNCHLHFNFQMTFKFLVSMVLYISISSLFFKPPPLLVSVRLALIVFFFKPSWIVRVDTTRSYSLERDKLRGPSLPAVTNRLVSDGELGKIVPNHLWFHLHTDVLLPVVHAHDASYHLWYNHHVAQVSLHGLWFFSVRSLAFRFAQLLQQRDRFPLDATAELAALAWTKEFHQVLIPLRDAKFTLSEQSWNWVKK